MTVGKDLHKYTIKEAKEWATKKELEPGLVSQTQNSIRLVAKGGTERVKPIDWDSFFSIMDKKGLAIYGTKEGWMRIMKKK